jgi:hypothetical protein
MPSIVVNIIALPTLFNFLHSHAFWDEGPRMIWDFNSSNTEEPNADETKQTMSFYIYTIAMLGIYERTHRLILGQVMDLNYLTWF